MKANLKIYLRFVGIQFRSALQYRTAFLLRLLAMLLSNIINFASIFIIVNKFNGIGQWDEGAIILMFGLSLLTFGISSLFFWEPMIENLEQHVLNGTFDNFMFRPVPPLYLLICQSFRYSALPQILLSIGILIYGFQKISFTFTLPSMVAFGIAIVTGIIIQSAIMLILGASTFWLYRSSSLAQTVVFPIRSFIDYPLDIYPIWIQFILTFLVPYGMVNFYPLQAILQSPSSKVVLLMSCYLLFAILFFTFTLWVWRRGLKKYHGAGG